MEYVLPGLGIIVAALTLAYAAGWIGRKEPDRTAEVLRQDAEWVKRLEREIDRDGTL